MRSYTCCSPALVVLLLACGPIRAIREGRNTDQHLLDTMTRFLRDNLQSPHAPAPEPIYEIRTLRGWTLHINRELLAADALTNPMEYFAETTEAYFGRNDFFPFTRDELKAHDPAMFELLGKLWQITAETVPSASPPTLTQQLLKKPPAQLAQAARERGDASRGAVLFFQPFLTCARCHDAETGTQLGPDLAQAGREATAEYLIESVLSPSKVIKQGYEPLIVSTTDGRTVTGLLVEEKNGALTLIDPAGGKRIMIPVADIEERGTGKQFLMPDGLVNLLSDRQPFLDLDGQTVRLELPDLAPTWCMEIKYRLKGTDGSVVAGVIHNTVHALGIWEQAPRKARAGEPAPDTGSG